MAAPAPALVLHPDTIAYPNSEEPPVMSDRPADAVVGWWNYNASAVAIGANTIVTTCHQGGGVGTTVSFGGVTYRVAEVFQQSKADLRIARITNMDGSPANLTNFVDYNRSTSESTQTAVIGGFGFGRGSITPNYYTWDWTDNKTERWGQNYVENTTYSIDPASFSSQLLWARFDNYGTGNWVDYEACVANYDSGGGWFLKDPDSGQWVVAGLSRGVTHAALGEAWFQAGSGQSPDVMDGVRLSSYTAWLDSALNRSVWNSTSGGTWSDGAKWSGGAPNASDKFAVFSDATPGSRTVTLSASAQIGTLRFDSPGDVTIAGSSQLEFKVSNTGNNYTWDMGLLETSNVNGNGTLTIAAPVKMTAPLLVRHNAGGLLTISGVISDPASAKALTKTGTGTLVLSGANTYKGGTTINQGTLRVTNASALGVTTSSYVTLEAGATLDVQSDSALTLANRVKVTTNPANTGLTTAYLNADRATAGPARTMTFGGTLTTDGAVTLSTTSAGGSSLAFSGLASITNLGAGNVATLNTASADLALTGGMSLATGTLVKSGPKMLTVSGAQAYGSGTTLKATEGALALNADAGSASAYNLGLVTSGGAMVNLGSTQHLASLSLGGTSVTSVASGGGRTLMTKGLDITGGTSPTATLDLADNNLVVDYAGGASPLLQVRDWVKHGANFDPVSGEMFWNGTGITSSAAAADPDHYSHQLLALGVRQAVDAGDYHMNQMTSVDGVALNDTSVVVKYTWMGDVNLDGKVTIDDYYVLDFYFTYGIAPELTGWWTGDLNGDGKITIDDYYLMDIGFTYQGAPLDGGGLGLLGLPASLQDTSLDAATGGAGTVPEPGTLLVLCVGAAGLLRKRRRG
ncbi:MAG: autotransporter-associated beta strand repeat-containing protein [Planctomycetota bacterium]|nr:autotransporter-associated beta strand repeat-containing protein [Planctomycetota bacterium]